MAGPPDTVSGITWCLCLVVSALTGVVWANDATCRTHDVEQQSHVCMMNFFSQLDAVRLNNHKFFTGVDAEIIRSVCSTFQESLTCLRNVREQCPRTATTFIDSLVEPYVPLHDLCILPEFYEQYAMNQGCFYRVRSQSDTCWAHFRSATADLVSEISSTGAARSSDRRRQDARSQFCGRLRHLQTCVKAAVHKTCKKLAAGLVDVLVRASVELSPQCAHENVTRHATTTLATSVARLDGAHGEQDYDAYVNTASAVTVTSSSCISCRWCLVLAAVTAVYVVVFADRNYSCRVRCRSSSSLLTAFCRS